MQKAIEVSHGSMGEFSRSTASQYYIRKRKTYICLFVSLLIICIVMAVLVPLFWYGHIPVISSYLKKSVEYRIPLTIAIEVLLFMCMVMCIYKIMRYSSSIQRRLSYLSSCSVEFNSSGDQPSRTRLPSKRSESLVTKKPANTSSIHGTSLRQTLEDLPGETVSKIQELAKNYLSSGNGRSSIEPRKFASKPKLSPAVSADHVHTISAKVLLIGDISVGKTSIFHRILYDQFSESYLQTIGVDLGFSTLFLSNEGEQEQLSVALQIWDIGGQGQLSNATKIYFRDAIIIIPVVDISNMQTLEALNWWFKEISDKVYDPYMILLLNKADLGNRAIKEDDINNIPELRGVERYEVSAKTGANVMKAFSETIAKVVVKETAKVLSI